MSETIVGSSRRWSMLAIGVAAQGTSAFFVSGAAFLIPTLHTKHGLTLFQAGILVAMPTVGTTLALVAWGALVDRIGERKVMTAGLLVTAAAGLAAILSSGFFWLGLFLLLGGVGSASTNSASGRVVVGWFPRERRGVVMGIRQMAQPLGVGVAALTVPGLAAAHGLAAALALPTLCAAVFAVTCWLVIKDPPRPTRVQAIASGEALNPYRGSSVLQRIHGVSVLLVVPQFVVWTYGLVWLISDRGWSPGSAGVLMTVAQVLGAAGRLLAGAWSDRLGSRLRPLRWVAVAAGVVMASLAAADAAHWAASAAILVLASVVSVADNGLAFTSVAEIAGPFWSGRALGAQNTAQFLAASLVPPVMGALVGWVGYPIAFAITAVFPVAAVPLVPKDAQLPMAAARG